MVDYEAIGLKVGIEVHQQLATSRKLFCECPCTLRSDEPDFTIVRRLRPTQSELGEVDPAAEFEFKKGRTIVYEAYKDTTCLVELDEEPPHQPDQEAIDIALTFAQMIGATPVDELYVLRKTVVDGSNPSGFQRSIIVALGGEIKLPSGKTIPIQTICVEEDAARKIKEEGMRIWYRVDRLGIPLIEVATAPVISSPKEAEEAALAIGRLLRATKRVRRGLGTVRQDVNISIRDGALIEVKGVQRLDLVSKVVEYEVRRQLELLKIRDELRGRGVKEEDIAEDFVDVTDVFAKTESRVIKSALKRGGVVLAVKLPGFAGLLGRELMHGVRLGTEMSDRARFWGRVGGIFHTDELPGYGITEEEVRKLREAVGAREEDAVVLVADARENAEDALRAVVERAIEALKGVPEETRAPQPDGTTRYMRPRPGASRMYPETDIRPIEITPEHLEEIRKQIPEFPEETVKRLVSTYGINEKLANQLLDSDYLELFEKICSETKVPPTFVAAALTETLKSLERDGVPVENLSEEQLWEVFKRIDEDMAAKEAFPDIATWLAKNPDKSVSQALEELGLGMLSPEEVEALVEEVVSRNTELIRERGERAFGALMGDLMREVRGRADAKLVAQMLRERIKKELEKSG